jgi:arylsulfatase A-like enzyme
VTRAAGARTRGLARVLAAGFALAVGAGFALACGGRGAPLAGANVLLVLVDTVRADHLGCYGYPLPTSPFIDVLARRGVLFERATSPASQTVPATLSLLSGVYPQRHGNQYYPQTGSVRLPAAGARPKAPPELPLLAEHLAQRGYRTGAVVGNPWLRPEYGFARGFERYEHLPVARRSRIRAQQVNEVARAILGDWRRERFLLYLHYMDAHGPYIPGERFRAAFAPSEPGQGVYRNGPAPDVSPQDLAHTRGLYDASIRELDEALAELWAYVGDLGIADDTLLVLVSDHGEEFHEHGGLGHGFTLYQEMLAVPFLLVHPALAPRRLPEPVTTLDLLPTLLALVAGESIPGVDGVSLAPALLGEPSSAAGDRVLLAELGFSKAARRGDHKMIRSPGHVQAFDLAADPAERQPLSAPAAWRDALLSALGELRDGPTLAETAPEPAPAAIDEDLLEKQLRALGYAQ